MEESSLMYNSYNPYGDFNSDIGNIIETEKKINEKLIKEYNKNKSKLLPLKDNKIDFEYIYEQITFVLNKTFDDAFNKKYKNIVKKDRWVGLGYIFIIIYLI